MSKPQVIAIVGPTASGKSSLGIYLAQHIGGRAWGGGEVISADSRQLYRGLDRGTGKVTKQEMQDVPHHLLDIASPKRQFSASDFVAAGEKVISKVARRGAVPIVVGGTGYYVDSLLGRITLPSVEPNLALRAQLEKKIAPQLFAMLQKKDPARATTIEPHHKRRLIRALEIAATLGKNPTPASSKKYDVLWLGINPGEKKLRTNVRARLLERLRNGMVAEAQKLHAAGLSYRRMEELGLEYRSLARLLKKEITKEEFVLELERAINQYAKRQLRWFRRNSDIRWIKNKAEALRLAKGFLK